MKRLALFILLVLLTASSQATFELQDPASQVYEEQGQDDEQPQESLGENPFCVIEIDDGQCFCIHKETKDKILLSDEECVAILSKPGSTINQ